MSKPNLKRVKFILTVAAIFTLFLGSTIIYQEFLLYKSAGNKIIFIVALNFLVSWISSFFFFYLISINRYVFYFFNSLTFILCGTASYFVINYNININVSSISTAFESNFEEVKFFLDIKLIIWILSYFIISLLINRAYKKYDSTFSNHYKLLFICAIAVTVFLCFETGAYSRFFPYNIYKNIGIYILQRTKLIDHKFDISKHYSYSMQEHKEKLNIVLVIGESARGDHFSINGYNRKTSPNLEKIKNLISYKNAVSCGIYTMDSLPCMLTRATRETIEDKDKETSLIGVFKKLDFNTIWIGNQASFYSFESAYMDLAEESHKTIRVNSEAGDVLGGFDERLLIFADDFLKNYKNKNNLIILHTRGSHFPYDTTYPDNFRKYKPVCKPAFFSIEMQNCSDEERINSYDNSILYTDYFLSQVIKRFQNKNAIMFYVSDHGESLGEEGRYLHGTYNDKEQIDIGMFIWVSDKFKKLYPRKFKNLQKSTSKAQGQDNIFHSLLDCSGIKSDIIDRKLSLCH